ncbi:MAG: hypothetical protein U0790_04475 [Isosphaeraceae bacterium]
MAESGSATQEPEAEDSYLETIALLQDEVARLEGELRARQGDEPPAPWDAAPPAPEAGEGPDGTAERDRLAAELGARDETITLLLEQLQLVEEAERATRAEWEQLASWVTELEDRVDRRDREEGQGLSDRLAGLEQQLRESQTGYARDRAAWDQERRELRREIERLAEAATAAGSPKVESPPGTRMRALEAEVRELRQRCLDQEAKHHQEVHGLTEALESARGQLEDARSQAAAVEDERERERREYETAVASLRAQVVRASLHATGQVGNTAQPSSEASTALEADLRIREFRQHLREIHAQEQESRSRSGLGARLTRLWNRTSPHRTGDPASGARP